MRSYNICLWLISFSIILSRSIHGIADGRISFFFFFGKIIWHCDIFLIWSSVNGYLDGFHLLAIVNNAAVHVEVQIPLWRSDFVSLRYIRRSKTAGSHNSSIFNVFRNLHNVSHNSCIIPPPVDKGSLFSTSSPAFVYCPFSASPSIRCEMIYHCGFYLHFSTYISDGEHLFMLAIHTPSLEKCLFRPFVKFLNQII